MHQVDAFGNSPGVCRKLAEGIRSLPGWRKGVRQKKTETCQKIIGGNRKACRERPEDFLQDYRRLPKYAGNPSDRQQLSAGKPPRWRVNRPYHRIWAAANC
ncbi:hypothetical protein B296_00019939 [Ensete ventricosum]|uniref:Uncharacterized protein n=1 Tax=Ensete ventricosum TaxID=4639 RepID=A0A426ZL84_ENSVE|nr:hypothetical protein B296_00019939 [Ensete ventricosum]